MMIILRLILILSFLNGVMTPFSKLGFNLISLFAAIINVVVVILIWKGLQHVTSNHEKPTDSIKTKGLRWLVLVYFSLTTQKIGVIIAFLVRFIVDGQIAHAIGRGQSWARHITQSGFYSEVFIILVPLLVSLPMNYALSKLFKFNKPFVSAAIIFVLWEVLMHIPTILGFMK